MAELEKQINNKALEWDKEKQKQNNQAAQDIEAIKSQRKIDKLDQKSQESVNKIIKELDKLRNNPAQLVDELNDGSLMSILESHWILVEDIKNLLAVLRTQDHQKHLAQIGAGDISQTPEIVQWSLGGLQEAYSRLWIDLKQKMQEAAPEDQENIAGLTREVIQAEDQTHALGTQLNALV